MPLHPLFEHVREQYLPTLLASHRITINRMYPDKKVHIQLQFDKWMELLNPDGSTHVTTSRHTTKVGIWLMNSSYVPLLLSSEWRDQMERSNGRGFTIGFYP